MPLIDLLYLALRLSIMSLALIAGIAGLLYAWQIGRHSRLRGLLVVAGAAMLLFTGSLSLSNALRYLRTPTMWPVLPEEWLWGVADALLPLLFIGYLRVAIQRDRALSQAESLAITDELTGLPNRRGFLLLAMPSLAQAWRRSRPSALVVADIDHFKAINDRFGHATGDTVLRGFGAAMRAVVRRGDVPGRTGGEEFVLLLPGETLEDARRIAERLRETVAARRFAGSVRITISCGIAVLETEPHEAALTRALEAADRALYAAKANGRNCVEVALPLATGG